jgi:hypothetical protein
VEVRSFKDSRKIKKHPAFRPDDDNTGKSELLQLFQAMRTDHLVLKGREITAASAEEAVRFIFAQNHGRALHKDLKHVFRTDVKRAAQFDGEDNTAQGIQLTYNTCRLHGKNLLQKAVDSLQLMRVYRPVKSMSSEMKE